MPIAQLPPELWVLVAKNLDNARDINAIARTNHTTYNLVNRTLYRQNIQDDRNSALRWAVRNGSSGTVRRCFEYGASLSALDEIADNYSEGWAAGSEPLPLMALAAAKGHNGILELLLEKAQGVHEGDINVGNPVSRALLNGHDACFRLLIAQKDINLNPHLLPLRDDEDKAPLSCALRQGSLTDFQLLLEHGADLRVHQLQGHEPLSEAAASGNRDLIQFLLDEHGFRSELKALELALWQASSDGDTELVKLFLGLGVELNLERRHGRNSATALTCAANGHHLEIVELLLSAGANVNCRDNNGRTRLHVAVRGEWERWEESVRLLLSHGAHMEARDIAGCTPLFAAAEYGFIVGIDLLLDLGACMEAKDNMGRTAVWWAVSAGSDDAAVFLLDRGAKRLCEGEEPRQLTLNSLRRSIRKVPKTLTILLDEGVFGADFGNEAVKMAIGNGSVVTLQMLIDRGDIDLNHATESTQETPLTVAAQTRSPDVVQLLVENGAVVDHKEHLGRTPLSLAISSRWKDKQVITLLVEAGADVNSRDSKGRTPVWYAASVNRGIYEYLLEKGGDSSLEDGDGVSPEYRLAQMEADRDGAELGRNRNAGRGW